MIGCMPTFATSRPFQRPQSAATTSAADDGHAHRVAAHVGLHAILDDELAADHQGGDRRADGHHGADRDVDAARRDHERHADRDERERRGAIEDVDDTAVEMPVAPLQLPEAGIEDGVDAEQQDQCGERPEQAMAQQALHRRQASAAIR